MTAKKIKALKRIFIRDMKKVCIHVINSLMLPSVHMSTCGMWVQRSHVWHETACWFLLTVVPYATHLFSMTSIHRRALHSPRFYTICDDIARNYLTLLVSTWRCHMAASALNLAFAKTISRCFSTVSWAVNTCLGIACDIESTSLQCWPRHRQRMSSQVCSLYRCEPGWRRRALDIHTTSITYSSYRYSSDRASPFLSFSAEI